MNAQELAWDEKLGQPTYSGKYLRLFRALDEYFTSWASDVQAVEYQFPSFVRAKELQKLDYFKSFPHLVTFAASLDSNEENLHRYTSGERINAKGEIQLTDLQPVEEVLTPAACYHFYILFQGKNFDPAQFFTTRCTCYRRESHFIQLKRQWNFSMREIVCIGSSDDVKKFIDHYAEKISKFVKKIGLEAKWDTATDPFFNPSQNPKFLMQRLDPVKNELVFKEDLAIASTNFHRNYFGEAFKIKSQGEDAYSGCVAFGVDRWVYAITEQYGTDEENWPKFQEISI